jgi:hypothetical protein
MSGGFSFGCYHLTLISNEHTLIFLNWVYVV